MDTGQEKDTVVAEPDVDDRVIVFDLTDCNLGIQGVRIPDKVDRTLSMVLIHNFQHEDLYNQTQCFLPGDVILGNATVIPVGTTVMVRRRPDLPKAPSYRAHTMKAH